MFECCFKDRKEKMLHTLYNIFKMCFSSFFHHLFYILLHMVDKTPFLVSHLLDLSSREIFSLIKGKQTNHQVLPLDGTMS